MVELYQEVELMYDDTIALAIEKYGIEAQSRVAMEECAELIQAINKCLRYPTAQSRSRLIEEIADVRIMIDQLCHIYDISETDVGGVQIEKIERLRKKLL